MTSKPAPTYLDTKKDTPPTQLFDPTVDLDSLQGMREYANRALVAAANGKVSGQQMAGIATLLRVKLDLFKEKPPKDTGEEADPKVIASDESQAMDILRSETPPRPRTWG